MCQVSNSYEKSPVIRDGLITMDLSLYSGAKKAANQGLAIYDLFIYLNINRLTALHRRSTRFLYEHFPLWMTFMIFSICSPVLVNCDLFVNEIDHNEINSPLQIPQGPIVGHQEDLFSNSYIIDNKRFSELMASRCFTSTILNEPNLIEPTFIIVKPNHELRINATASHETIMQAAGFEPRKRTVVFVHGFTQSFPETDWLIKMRSLFVRLRNVERYNLIYMDWGKGAQNPFFSAAANAHGMGTFLAIFLQRLIDLGADRLNIHVVGHSLGAHVAGFAGKRIRPPIGRITALDPAGPCFGKFFANPFNYRLCPDDAYQVDVLHYDDGFLGLGGQHGQFDIYVNGGSSQPGCTNDYQTMMSAFVTMVFRRDRTLSESHTRSTEVPVSLLHLGNCQQVAYECSSYQSFLNGECGQCDEVNNQCFLMSFDFQFEEMDEMMPLRTSRPGKRMFIKTKDRENFCLQHYQIKIHLVPNSSSVWFRNQASLVLIGSNGQSYEVVNHNEISENVLTGLLTTDGPPTRIIRGYISPPRGLSSSLSVSSMQSADIESIEINFMSNINYHIRRAMSSKLCVISSSGSTNSLDQEFGEKINLIECL